MSETDRDAAELSRLLGREQECPAAFVWSVVAGVGMGLLVVLLPALRAGSVVMQTPHQVFYAVAGLNLLALVSGSVILIRKRIEGGGHG